MAQTDEITGTFYTAFELMSMCVFATWVLLEHWYHVSLGS